MNNQELIKYHTRIKKSKELMNATTVSVEPSYGYWGLWAFVNRN